MRRFFASLRQAASWGGFAIALALSVSGLSADSREATDNGGFLYSDYLTTRGDASFAAGELFGKAGSFDVQLRQTALEDGRAQILAAAKDELANIPLREWALGYLFNDTEASDIVAAGRLRTTAGGWRLLETTAQAAVSAATANAKESGFIRHIRLDFQSRLGGRLSSAGLDVLGALRESEDDAAAWQLRAFAGGDENYGGNAGLIYRRAFGDQLAGFNIFTDYEYRQRASFFRWSGGGEYRSPWVDIFGNYYEALSDPIFRSDAVLYTTNGFDAEFHLHSPRHRWLTAIAGYYFYQGKFARLNETGFRAGLKFSPQRYPLVVELEYDAGDGRSLGGRVEYNHSFGNQQNNGGGVAVVRPQDWFFVPANREYTQRIHTVQIGEVRGWSLRELSPLLGEVEIKAGDANVVAIASADGFNIVGTQDGNAVNFSTTVYPLPLSSVAITIITGPVVGGTEITGTSVTAAFSYSDEGGSQTTVRVGSTVAFAASGARGFSLLDGNAVIETKTPIAAVVLNDFGGGVSVLASVLVMETSTVSLAFDKAANNVEIQTDGGGFNAIFLALTQTLTVSVMATAEPDSSVSVGYDGGAMSLAIGGGDNMSVMLFTPGGTFSCAEGNRPPNDSIISCPSLDDIEMRGNTAYNEKITIAGASLTVSRSQVNVEDGVAQISYSEPFVPDTMTHFAILTVAGSAVNYTFSILGDSANAVSVGANDSQLFLRDGFTTGSAAFIVQAVGSDNSELLASLTLVLSETVLPNVAVVLQNPAGGARAEVFSFTGFENTPSTLASIVASGGVGSYSYAIIGGAADLLDVDADGRIMLVSAPTSADLNAEYKITVLVSDADAAGAAASFASATDDYTLRITATLTDVVENLRASVIPAAVPLSVFRAGASFGSFLLPQGVVFSVQVTGGITLSTPPYRYEVVGNDCVAVNSGENPVCPPLNASTSALSVIFSVNADGEVSWDSAAAALVLSATLSPSAAAVYTPTVRVVDSASNAINVEALITLNRALEAAFVRANIRTQRIALDSAEVYQWAVSFNPAAPSTTDVIVALTTISDAAGISVVADVAGTGGRLTWDGTNNELLFNTLLLADNGALYTATLAIMATGAGAALTPEAITLILTMQAQVTAPLAILVAAGEVKPVLYESDVARLSNGEFDSAAPIDIGSRRLPGGDEVFRLLGVGGGGVASEYRIVSESCVVMAGPVSTNCGHTSSIFAVSTTVLVTMVAVLVTNEDGTMVPELDNGNPLFVATTVTGYAVMWADAEIRNVDEAEYVVVVEANGLDVSGTVLDTDLATVTITAYSIQRLQATVMAATGGDGSVFSPLMLTLDQESRTGSSDVAFATVSLFGGVGGGTLSWSCDAAALIQNNANNVSGINVLPAGCTAQNSDLITLSYPNGGANLLVGDNTLVFTVTDNRRSEFETSISAFMPNAVITMTAAGVDNITLNICTPEEAAVPGNDCDSYPLDIAADVLLTIYAQVRAAGFAEFADANTFNTRAIQNGKAVMMHADPDFTAATDDVRFVVYDEVADLANLIIGGAAHNAAFAASITLVELTTPSDLLTVGIGRQCDYGGGGCVDSLRFRSAEELAALTIPPLMTLTVSINGRTADSRDFAPLDGALTLVLGKRNAGVLDMGAEVEGTGLAASPFIVPIDPTNLQMILGTVLITTGSNVAVVSVDEVLNFTTVISELRTDVPRPVSIMANNVLVYSGDLSTMERNVATVTLAHVRLGISSTSTSTLTINYAPEGRYALEIAVSGQNARDALLSQSSGNFIHFQTRDIADINEDCVSDNYHYQSIGQILANDGVIKPGDLYISPANVGNGQVLLGNQVRALLHNGTLFLAGPLLDSNSVRLNDCPRRAPSAQGFLVGPNFEVIAAGSNVLLGAANFSLDTGTSNLSGAGTRLNPLLITLDADFSPPQLLLGHVRRNPTVTAGENYQSLDDQWTVESAPLCGGAGCEFGFAEIDSPRSAGVQIARLQGGAGLYTHYVYVNLIAPVPSESIALSTYFGVSGSGTAGDPLVVPFLRGATADEHPIVRLSIATPRAGFGYRFVSTTGGDVRSHSWRFASAADLARLADGILHLVGAESGESGGLLRFLDGVVKPGLSTVSVVARLVDADNNDLHGADLLTVVHIQASELTQDDLRIVFTPHSRLTTENVANRLSVYGSPLDMSLAGSAEHPFVFSRGADLGSFGAEDVRALLSISLQVAGVPSGFAGVSYSGAGSVKILVEDTKNFRLDFDVASPTLFQRDTPSDLTNESFYGQVIVPWINVAGDTSGDATPFPPSCVRGDIVAAGGGVTKTQRLHIIYTPALSAVVDNSCTETGELQLVFQHYYDLESEVSVRISVFGSPADPLLHGTRTHPFVIEANKYGDLDTPTRILEVVAQKVSASGTVNIRDIAGVDIGPGPNVSIGGGRRLHLQYHTGNGTPPNDIHAVVGINVNGNATTGSRCAQLPVLLRHPSLRDLGEARRTLFLHTTNSFPLATNVCDEGIESRGLESSLPGDGSADTPLIFNTPRRITTIVNAADTDEYSENITTIVDATIAAGEVLATVRIIGDLNNLTVSLAANSSPLLSINMDTRVLSFASAVPVVSNSFYTATIIAETGSTALTIAANVALRVAGCNALYHQAEYLLIRHSLYNIFGSQSFVRLIDNGNQEVPITSLPSRPTQYPHGFRSRGFRAGDIIYRREGDFLTQRFGSNGSNPELAAARTEDRWTVFNVDDSDVDAGQRQYLARLVLDAGGDSVNSCARPLESGEFVAPDDYSFAAADSAPLYSDLRGITVPATITLPTPADLPVSGTFASAVRLATVVANVEFDGGVYPQYNVAISDCRDIEGLQCRNIDSVLRVTPQGRIIVLPALDSTAATVRLFLTAKDGAAPPITEEIVMIFPGVPAESACLALPENQQPFIFPNLQGAINLYDNSVDNAPNPVARFPKWTDFQADQFSALLRTFDTGTYTFFGVESGQVRFSGASRAPVGGDFLARVRGSGPQRTGNFGRELTPPLRDHRAVTGISYSDIGFMLYTRDTDGGELGIAITDNPGDYSRLTPFLPRRGCGIQSFGEFMVHNGDFTQLRDPADYMNALTAIVK